MNKGSLFFHLHHHTLPRQRAGAERGGEERATTRTTCKKGDVVRPSVRWWKRCWPAAASSSPSTGGEKERIIGGPAAHLRAAEEEEESVGTHFESKQPLRLLLLFPPSPRTAPAPTVRPTKGIRPVRRGGRGERNCAAGKDARGTRKLRARMRGRSGGELPSSELLLVERSRYHRGGCSTHFSLRRRRGGKGYRERGSGLRSPFLALHCHGSALSLSLSGLAGGEATRGCRAFACDSDPFSFGRERMQGYGQTAEKRRRGAIGGIYQTARHSTRRAVFIAFFYVGDW